MLRTTLLVAAASAVAASNDVYGQASPVVGWSGLSGMFSNADGVVTDDVAVSDLAPYFQLDKDPKVAVVFALADASTRDFPHLVKDGELSLLVEAIHDAEAGIVVPNTYGAGSGIETFVKALPRVAHAGAKPTLFVREEDSVTKAVSDTFDIHVLDMSSLDRAVAMDGTTFLYVPLTSGNDHALSGVMQTVTEGTSGNFVAFAVPASYEEPVAAAAAAAAPRKLQATGSAKAAPALNQVRMTPNIMLGLLVSVFFIFVLYISFGKMMDIRPNDKHWLSENVPLGNKVEL